MFLTAVGCQHRDAHDARVQAPGHVRQDRGLGRQRPAGLRRGHHRRWPTRCGMGQTIKASVGPAAPAGRPPMCWAVSRSLSPSRRWFRYQQSQPARRWAVGEVPPSAIIPGAPVQGENLNMDEFQTNGDLAYVVRSSLMPQRRSAARHRQQRGLCQRRQPTAVSDLELEDGVVYADRIIDARGLGQSKNVQGPAVTPLCSSNGGPSRLVGVWRAGVVVHGLRQALRWSVPFR